MQRPLHTAGPESPTCKITAATPPTPPAAGTIRFSEESRALLDDDRKPRGRYFTAQRRRTPLWALVLFGVAGTLTLFVVCRFFSAMLGGGHREAAFAMSLGAGMSTGIGAAFVLVTTSLDRRLLAATLSFSAGVMLYVSLVEVIGVADEYFAKGDGVRADVAYFHATLSFFAGVAIMAVVDKLVKTVVRLNAKEFWYVAPATGRAGGDAFLARLETLGFEHVAKDAPPAYTKSALKGGDDDKFVLYFPDVVAATFKLHRFVRPFK